MGSTKDRLLGTALQGAFEELAEDPGAFNPSTETRAAAQEFLSKVPATMGLTELGEQILGGYLLNKLCPRDQNGRRQMNVALFIDAFGDRIHALGASELFTDKGLQCDTDVLTFLSNGQKTS